jgi:hypothetical protein
VRIIAALSTQERIVDEGRRPSGKIVRRLKIIPNAFGEHAVLKLMFGALIRATERWRSVKSATSNVGSWLRSGKSSIRNTRPSPASIQSPQRMETLPENPAPLGLELCDAVLKSDRRTDPLSHAL